MLRTQLPHERVDRCHLPSQKGGRICFVVQCHAHGCATVDYAHTPQLNGTICGSCYRLFQSLLLNASLKMISIEKETFLHRRTENMGSEMCFWCKNQSRSDAYLPYVFNYKLSVMPSKN